MSTGLHVSDLETPAVVIDLDILERNLARLAAYGREHHLRLRPHTKTHKIPALARKQLNLGAAGLTVAKVGEAEVMLGADPPDLLVAFPVIGRGKLDRLMEVSRHTNVTVALDSLCAARQLSDAAQTAQAEIGVLAEADVGLGRVGVAPGPELVDLAREIDRQPGLRFQGIAFYPGHVKLLDEDGLKALDRLKPWSPCWKIRAGLTAAIVRRRLHANLFHSHRRPRVERSPPGTYIFNDRNTVQRAAPWRIARRPSSPLWYPPRTQARSSTADRKPSHRTVLQPARSASARLDAPQAVFGKMNEEHGFIDVHRAERAFCRRPRAHPPQPHLRRDEPARTSLRRAGRSQSARAGWKPRQAAVGGMGLSLCRVLEPT
jgi:D-serine deaminase-like pyridoxal phosphate-dependent protein